MYSGGIEYSLNNRLKSCEEFIIGALCNSVGTVLTGSLWVWSQCLETSPCKCLSQAPEEEREREKKQLLTKWIRENIIFTQKPGFHKDRGQASQEEMKGKGDF